MAWRFDTFITHRVAPVSVKLTLYPRILGAIYTLHHFQRLQFAPQITSPTLIDQTSWDVLAINLGSSFEMGYDMFVYDAQTRKLALVILGVILTTAGAPTNPVNMPTISVSHHLPEPVNMQIPADIVSTTSVPKVLKLRDLPVPPAGTDAKTSIFEDICKLLKELADIPAEEIQVSASFDDLGVDSLMVSRN